MILNHLGIFGWKEADENLVLASLLTGDPLLLIDNHGCAKTHVADKVAQLILRASPYSEVIKVVDAADLDDGVTVRLNANMVKQRVVCYIERRHGIAR